MRKLHGEWIASEKDTWDLDNVLSPIILAGLKKFREVITDRANNGKVYGIPVYITDNYDNVTDKDMQRWLDIIDLMIYAFDNNEPTIEEYGIRFLDEYDNDTVFAVDDIEAWGRYMLALKAHKAKQLRGRQLFAEYYNDLWW